MQITFTHTEYHAEPEHEAIWILTADVYPQYMVDVYGHDHHVGTVVNIQTALTHEGPVKISDIDPRLLAEMEQAATAWVNDGRESLPEMYIGTVIQFLPNGIYQLASYNGRTICTGDNSLSGWQKCFNALLQHINSPQTQS